MSALNRHHPVFLLAKGSSARSCDADGAHARNALKGHVHESGCDLFHLRRDLVS